MGVHRLLCGKQTYPWKGDGCGAERQSVELSLLKKEVAHVSGTIDDSSAGFGTRFRSARRVRAHPHTGLRAGSGDGSRRNGERAEFEDLRIEFLAGRIMAMEVHRMGHQRERAGQQRRYGACPGRWILQSERSGREYRLDRPLRGRSQDLVEVRHNQRLWRIERRFVFELVIEWRIDRWIRNAGIRYGVAHEHKRV